MKALEGKIALVTGGSRGLGLSIAQKLVEQGAQVIITVRNQSALTDAAKVLGEKCLPLQMDIRNPASVKEGFAIVGKTFGHLS